MRDTFSFLARCGSGALVALALGATTSFGFRLPEPAQAPAEVTDFLFMVQEAPTGHQVIGKGVNSDTGLTGSIILNERNFDLLRPPTSLDDLFSGQAFRGAGQEYRLEAVPGTQFQRSDIHFGLSHLTFPGTRSGGAPDQPN
jgi:outer membrane protein assembly factor BamA